MVKDKSDNRRLRLYSFSPWILGSACILLLLLLAFFAISNYKREKQLITGTLEQKGLTLARFVSSSVGDSIRSSMRRSLSYEKWETHMQSALELALEQPGVDFISIVDRRGNILLSAGDSSFIKNQESSGVVDLIAELQLEDTRLGRTKIVSSEGNGTEKAIIAIRYNSPGQLKRKNNSLNFQHEGRFRRSHHFQSFKDDMKRVGELAPVYLLQLDSSEFTAPLQRQFIQIILELLAIILVGIGGTLSFYTLRGLKGSEENLGKMRGFNDALVSSLPIGILATGDSGTLQVINDAAEKITSVTSGVVGKMPQSCLPPSVAIHFSPPKNHSEIYNNNNIHTDEVIFGQRSLELTVFPVGTERGVFVGEVMLLKDVTEVKRLQKELQRSERLAVVGKMAAGVAHELRNPLSSIKGLALLLQSKVSGSAEDERTAETFVAEVERLNRSIGELLDYAKPASLALKACSIDSLLNKSLSLIGPDLESYKVTVTKQVADNLPQVLIDKDKMSQVILNILLNSLQAMEEVDRDRKLDISLYTKEPYIVLKISDNGVGIVPDILKKIFDPYFTTKRGGTGLGLALSQKTVEEHGGKLLVSSIQDKETEVQLLFRSL